MNITCSSIWSYGNKCMVNHPVREYTTTTWEKYWQETNWSEMLVNAAGVQCHRAGIFTWPQCLHMLDLHGRDKLRCWYPTSHNYILWNILQGLLCLTHQSTASGMALLHWPHWVKTDSSQLNWHLTSVYFPYPNFSTRWKKTANLLLQLPVQWSSPQFWGQPFQTIQL